MSKWSKVLILLLIFQLSYSQNPYEFITDSTINVMPFWKKGLKKYYKYSKSKYSLPYGKTSLKKLDSINYIAKFEVIYADHSSYKIKWSPFIRNANSNELIAITPLVYSTDDYGNVTQLDNLDEVIEIWRKAMNSILNSNTNNFIKKNIEEILNSDQTIESFVLYPINLIHELIGYQFDRHGESYSNVDIINLGISNDTLNTKEEYFITDLDEAKKTFAYHQKTSYDKESSLKFFKNLNNKVFDSEDAMKFYENRTVLVDCLEDIKFDLNIGLPKEILSTKNVKLYDRNDQVLLLNYIEKHEVQEISQGLPEL